MKFKFVIEFNYDEKKEFSYNSYTKLVQDANKAIADSISTVLETVKDKKLHPSVFINILTSLGCAMDNAVQNIKLILTKHHNSSK